MVRKMYKVVVNGQEFPSVAAMCRHFNIVRSYWDSLIKKGVPNDEALKLCLSNTKTSRKKQVVIRGMEFDSIGAAAAYFDLNATSVYTKMCRKKYTAEEAIESLTRFSSGGAIHLKKKNQ